MALGESKGDVIESQDGKCNAPFWLKNWKSKSILRTALAFGGGLHALSPFSIICIAITYAIWV